MAEAYPLHWPEGWPRTPPNKRQWGRFEVQPGVARTHLLHEIQRMGGRYPVISSNIALRRDGLPYANQNKIEDPGIAVYFERDGKQMVFACDQYDAPWKNIRAISKTIEALRGIERWGASEMMERAFSAFEALPPPKSWREVLGLNGTSVSHFEIEAAFRAKAKTAHPDHGGSTAAMAELNEARRAALEDIA